MSNLINLFYENIECSIKDNKLLLTIGNDTYVCTTSSFYDCELIKKNINSYKLSDNNVIYNINDTEIIFEKKYVATMDKLKKICKWLLTLKTSRVDSIVVSHKREFTLPIIRNIESQTKETINLTYTHAINMNVKLFTKLTNECIFVGHYKDDTFQEIWCFFDNHEMNYLRYKVKKSSDKLTYNKYCNDETLFTVDSLVEDYDIIKNKCLGKTKIEVDNIIKYDSSRDVVKPICFEITQELRDFLTTLSDPSIILSSESTKILRELILYEEIKLENQYLKQLCK